MLARFHPGKALSARLDDQFGPGVALIYLLAFIILNYVTRYAAAYLTGAKTDAFTTAQLFAECLAMPVFAYCIGLVIWLLLRIVGLKRNVKIVVYSFFYALYRITPVVIIYNLLPILMPTQSATTILATLLGFVSFVIIFLTIKAGTAHPRAHMVKSETV